MNKNETKEIKESKENINKEKISIRNIIKRIFQNIGILLLIFLVLACRWAYSSFQIKSFSAVLFELTQPLDGVSSEVVKDGVLNIVVLGIIVYIVIKLLWYFVFYFKKNKNNEIIEKDKRDKDSLNKVKFIKSFIIILSIIISLTYIVIKIDLIQFIKYSFDESTLIEENYVDPKNIKITFPENKRNLIYIVLESMETSFSDSENGGIFTKNLIPEITNLAKENISFSNTDKVLGGAPNYPGTYWTVGSLASQMTGLPLKLTIEMNSYGSFKEFLPGAYSIGELLEEEGYINEFICGSDISFGGRDKFFTKHGNYKIFDYNYATENEIYTHDKIWWGYQDFFLYEFAKQEIINLANSGSPFNATILTVDTHHPYGAICERCNFISNKDYSNQEQYNEVISCASKQLDQFISWIKTQPFYENTTIVIVGDHTTMSNAYEDIFKSNDYLRTVVNIFINAVNDNKNVNYKNRSFSQMDMFPTVLSAMGVKIQGDKLGIGTNLFSNKKTLAEEYGYEKLNEELSKKSSFYDKKILNNK